MANKNINKFIAFAAITGAAIAAGIAYFKHKNDTDLFDEDFDEEDVDFDFPLPSEADESSIKREYVSLNKDTESSPIEKSKPDESKADETTSNEMSITDESNFEDAPENSNESASFYETKTIED